MVYRMQGRHIWMLKYYRDGRPTYESSKTTSKQAAMQLLERREEETRMLKQRNIARR